MVMLEQAASERGRPLPPPTFSAPFSSPTLQWPRKKRQRCPNPILDHLLSDRRRRRRLASPSPDPPPSSSSPSSTTPAAESRRRASPSRSPAPPSSLDSKRPPIRPRVPRKEDSSSFPACALAEGSSPHQARADAAEKRKDNKEDEEDGRAGSEEGCFERMHLRPRASCGGATGGRKKKVEMWISLSRDEIEEDYYSITGCKLPRRPKRRPRTTVHPTVLNRIFPGSWLPNTVTLDMYRVHEPIDQRKAKTTNFLSRGEERSSLGLAALLIPFLRQAGNGKS